MPDKLHLAHAPSHSFRVDANACSHNNWSSRVYDPRVRKKPSPAGFVKQPADHNDQPIGHDDRLLLRLYDVRCFSRFPIHFHGPDHRGAGKLGRRKDRWSKGNNWRLSANGYILGRIFWHSPFRHRHSGGYGKGIPNLLPPLQTQSLASQVFTNALLPEVRNGVSALSNQTSERCRVGYADR